MSRPSVKSMVFFPLVILLAMILYSVYEDVKEKTIDDWNRQQMILAKQAAVGIETYFQHYYHDLQYLARNDSIIFSTTDGKILMRDYWEYNSREVKAITRVSANGRILYTAPYNPKVINMNISGQDHVREILKTHKPVVSDVFQAVQGHEAVAYHVPVFEYDDFKGSLAILIPFDVIAKCYLENLVIGETGYAWVISQSGVELYCPVPGHIGGAIFETSKKFPAVIAMAQKMIQGKSGVATYNYDQVRGKRVESVTKHAVYYPIKLDNTIWSIAVATPEKEILAPIRGFRNKLILIFAILTIAGTVYFYYILRARAVLQEQAKRERAEAALKSSEEKYRELVENANSIIMRFDSAGRITFFNEYAQRLFGFTEEEVLGRSLLETITPETETTGRDLRGFADDLFQHPERYANHENENILRSGERIWVSWANKVVVDEDGRLLEILSIGQNITERKKAEEEFGRAQALLQAAIDQTPAGIMVADVSDARIRLVNRAALELLGSSKKPLTGSTSYEQLKNWQLLHEDGSVCKTDDLPLARAIREGRVTRDREMIIRRKDGELRWVSVNASPVHNKQGDIIAGIVVFPDIAERKAAEAEKERLESQLRQSQKMEAIGTLASGIAHDFNNILQAIGGYVQLIESMKDLDPHIEKYAQEIDAAAQRAGSLVLRLLTFSRKVEPELKSVDIKREVLHAVQMLERTIPRMIDIETILPDDLWPINADQNQLNQIFMNLGANARDAMPDGGRLVFEARNTVVGGSGDIESTEIIDGRYVVLIVSDTGTGMNEDTLKQIFDPFFTTKMVGKGTGLGLSIVYGIMKGHGGYVRCDSAMGKGTVFRLYFPVRAHSDSGDDRVPDYSDQAAPVGNETVLLVDDEDAIIDVAREMLEQSGYRVFTASSGEDALALLQTTVGRIDLIVLDLGMPGMGGQACLKELLRLNPDQKVIIASGYSVTEEANAALESGAKGFLNKPYRLASLLKKVRDVLDA